MKHLHRPYDFTMTMMSGLAFHQNEAASRYIPIYFNEYKEIFDFIPPFLCANQLSGFRIPIELNKLIGFVKQTPIGETEMSQKVRFFVEKLKKQVTSLKMDSHTKCFKRQCTKVEKKF